MTMAACSDRIIDELRLPRALTAFAIGGLLAVAGVLMQVLLRNPLADPVVLGVSGGRQRGLAAMLLALPVRLVHAGGAGRRAAQHLLVFGLTHSGDDWRSDRLLLTGSSSPPAGRRADQFRAQYQPRPAPARHAVLADGRPGRGLRAGRAVDPARSGVLLRFAAAARDLNIAAQGMLQAAALGVDTARLRLELYFAGAILTAAAVAVAGRHRFCRPDRAASGAPPRRQ